MGVADKGNLKIRKITPTGIVSTLAGSGSSGATNGAGATASFAEPTGVAVDASDNVFVADYSGNRIRKISPDGVVSTFAGGSSPGSRDDQGEDARFRGPSGIAIGTYNDLYVTDVYNYKIRHITPSGLVTTLAGTGEQGTNDGSNETARFNDLNSIVVDQTSGARYVSDWNSHKIRKVIGSVSTFAGSGSQGSTDATGTAASFGYPSGMAVVSENIYVADYLNHKIRKISTSGAVTTFAGSGVDGSTDAIGTAASFKNPIGVAADVFGNLYVVDYGDHKIRKISLKGYSVTPALPLGLSIDPTTGVISGVPLTITPSTTYIITGRNIRGSSNTTVTFATTCAVASPAITTNNALSFDGIDDFVRITSCNNVQHPITNRSAFTIEYWFKGSNLQSAVRIQDGRSSIVSGWNNQHIISSASAEVGTYNGVAIGPAATDGSWHHIAITWEQNFDFKSYLDGVVVDQRNARVFPLPTFNADMFIGSFNGTSEFMKGMIDEVRVWSVVRTQAEIQASANGCTFALPQSGLELYLTFNHGVASGSNAGSVGVANSATTNFSGAGLGFAFTGNSSNWVVGAPIVPLSSLTPSVSINASAINIARGTNVTFTATITNGNASPTYQWKKNGTNVGANSNSYSDANLFSRDVITCSMTPSRETCINFVTAISNSLTITVTGVPAAAALNFDGADDYANLPTAINTNVLNSAAGFTVEAWVKPMAHHFSQRLIDLGNYVRGSEDYYDNIVLAMSEGTSGKPFIHLRNGTTVILNITSTSALTLGTWSHIAFSYDASSKMGKIYINGLVVASGTASAALTNVARSNAYLAKSNSGAVSNISCRGTDRY